LIQEWESIQKVSKVEQVLNVEKLQSSVRRGGGGGGGIDVVKNKKTYNQIYHSCKEV